MNEFPILQGGNPVVRQKYIPGLNGIRAMCVMSVMVAHYGWGSFVPGGLGVTVFFFLSGFLITTLMIEESNLTGGVSVRHFYVRRILRLSPELLFLLVFSSLTGLVYGTFSVGNILAALTYTSNYFIFFMERSGSYIRWPHLWSLAVEEHYYLAFPILFVALRCRIRTALVVLCCLCLLCLSWRCWTYYAPPFGLGAQNSEHPYTYIATDARFDSILYGAIGAFLFRKIGLSRKANDPLFMFALLLGPTILLSTLLLRDPFFRETLRYSLQGIGIILIFLGLYYSDLGSSFITLLELPFMRWMGQASYAAYLWHLEPLFLFKHSLGVDLDVLSVPYQMTFVAVATALTFFMAYLSGVAAAPITRLRSKLHSAKSERR